MMLSFAGKSILVVDDESMLREILAEELGFIGASVMEAASGNKAIEILKDKRVDIVISDVRMPDGDGLRLITYINSMPTDRPLVFLCSGFSDIAWEQAKSLGVLEIFPKPFSIDNIVHAIAKASGMNQAS